jgi:hypothetical protein
VSKRAPAAADKGMAAQVWGAAGGDRPLRDREDQRRRFRRFVLTGRRRTSGTGSHHPRPQIAAGSVSRALTDVASSCRAIRSERPIRPIMGSIREPRPSAPAVRAAPRKGPRRSSKHVGRARRAGTRIAGARRHDRDRRRNTPSVTFRALCTKLRRRDGSLGAAPRPNPQGVVAASVGVHCRRR